MTTDKLWNAKYWSKRIAETTEEVAPILKKLNNTPSASLTYEEMFLLRSCLQHYRSYSNLLADDMTEPDPVPKKPFWKKLIRK